MYILKPNKWHDMKWSVVSILSIYNYNDVTLFLINSHLKYSHDEKIKNLCFGKIYNEIIFMK